MSALRVRPRRRNAAILRQRLRERLLDAAREWNDARRMFLGSGASPQAWARFSRAIDRLAEAVEELER